ncbi:MAG TPA: PAS domain S-box protein [Candidatus Didemnitutus sp.]|nr:PAS domain S-box protein [Candidatus Didemnitutus sp.]
MSVVSCDSIAGAAAFPPPEDILGAWAGSAALVYCRDEAGRILAANRSFARKFGCMASELPGRMTSTFMHPDDAASLAMVERGTRPPTAAGARESRWLTPQGWRWIAWEESALVDRAGRVIGVRAVGHDITRQRVAEEQYFKLSSAVEQSPIAIAITNAEGHVQYVNAKFTQVTGYTLEQILDHGVQVLREGHPDEASYQKFWETVRAGGEWRGEVSRQRPDGKRTWESMQVSCLRNAAGEITNLLCMREDITERRLLEDQLRQAQKMESLGTLAGGIAHDFNNIIAVINGYAELALLNPGDSNTLQKSVREIKRAAQRASGLVRQILTFSRKAEVKFAPLDMNQHARDLVALLSETFPRNITFTFALDEQLPPLFADQNQLQQIVLNLCVNARDAMPTGGVISLTTTRVADAALPSTLQKGRSYACLAIGDTGTGMTPEVRARIFEPFFTTKAVNQGTGLGLAVVYGIVASHEGTIEVESQPGVGSTFKVYLPLVDNAVIAPVAVRSTDFPGGAESLLVVDDEAPLRLLLEAALSRKGYRVTSATDGLDAIEKLADPAQQFAAILLDLNMPGASGVEVMRVLRATRPEAKVLVLTGHLTPQARAEFERLGQRHFVRKPYTLDELGRNLRALLEGQEIKG